MKKVIVDLDGTVFDCSHRLHHIEKSPKDWDSFHEDCILDTPIYPIVELVKVLSKSYKIVFCTGRPESSRQNTLISLQGAFNIIVTAPLLMRKNHDRRQDFIIKPELLKAEGISKNDVAFILEDRNSVVEQWRKLGFTCLQVKDGNY